MEETAYRNEVLNRVKRAVDEGAKSYFEVLLRTEGADPRLVKDLIAENKCFDSEVDLSGSGRGVSVTAIRSKLLEHLPAADPALGQWWYTPDTQEQLATRMVELRPMSIDTNKAYKTLLIGAPTLAPLLDKLNCEVTLIEQDKHVLSALNDICKIQLSLQMDVLQKTPNLKEKVHVALIDPPWYPDEMDAFISVAINNLVTGGHILVSLPPLLTRPSIHTERNELIQRMQDWGMEVLFLDRNILRYSVPRFEESAFQDVDGFCAYPWRVADLLICKKPDEITIPKMHVSPQKTSLTLHSFCREPNEFRVFLGKGPGNLPDRVTILELSGFSKNVSRRSHDEVFPNVWTSEKTGAEVSSIDEALLVLASWQAGESKEQTATKLEQQRADIDETTANEIVKKYDDILGLWSRFQHESLRRKPKQIVEFKQKIRSNWSTTNSKREHELVEDGFRPEFSRDRDRILWCGSFRKLSGKTQLFPSAVGDQLRQRLAHSIEVMQLATTISESFGLDSDLVEAGALAHDIGHTPFGHAGEYALDKLLSQLSPKDEDTAHGFNHYEHGVDVVRFLEGPYQQRQGMEYEGLNLTPEVSECIFKHTFCQGGNVRFSHEQIRNRSKHLSYLMDGFCHLEGQAVRIADKISYLISDLEDGIRLDVIDDSRLLSCRLFHRPPIDMGQPTGESLLRRFLTQRRNIIKVLMEDVINETGRRMARHANPSAVRQHDDYLINHSPELGQDVGEVWKKLQGSLLHRDTRVVRANLQASKIVGELTLLFSIFPQYVSDTFAREHGRLWAGNYLKHYRDEFGADVSIAPSLISFLPLERYIGGGDSQTTRVRIENLIMAKDFVASLTDVQAKSLHRDLLHF